MSKMSWAIVIAGVIYLDYRRRRGQLGNSVSTPSSAVGTEPWYTPETRYPTAPKPLKVFTLLPPPVIRGGLPAATVVDVPDVPDPYAERQRQLERQMSETQRQAALAMQELKRAYAERGIAPPSAPLTELEKRREAEKAMEELKQAYAKRGLPAPSAEASREYAFQERLERFRNLLKNRGGAAASLYEKLEGRRSGFFGGIKDEDLERWARAYESLGKVLPSNDDEAYSAYRSATYQHPEIAQSVKEQVAESARSEASASERQRAEQIIAEREREALRVASEQERAMQLVAEREKQLEFEREMREHEQAMRREEAERKRKEEIRDTFNKTFDMSPRWFGLEGDASIAARWKERFGTEYPQTAEGQERALQNAQALFAAEDSQNRARVEAHREKLEAGLKQEVAKLTQDLSSEVRALREQLEQERLTREGYIGESAREINKRNYIDENLQQASGKLQEEAYGYWKVDKSGKPYFQKSEYGPYDERRSNQLHQQEAQRLAVKFEELNPPAEPPKVGSAIGFPSFNQEILDQIRKDTLKRTESAFIKDIAPYRAAHGDYTASSATRMLFSWVSHMMSGMKPSRDQIQLAVQKFVSEAVKGKQQSAIARAYKLAADASLSSEERIKPMIELARTLNATRNELAAEHTPRALEEIGEKQGLLPLLNMAFGEATTPPPKVTVHEKMAILARQEEERVRLASQEQYRVLEQALLAPVPTMATPIRQMPIVPGSGMDSLDSIAAMEFRPKRRRRSWLP